MRLLTREQSQLVDQRATQEFHLSSEVLMENAGLAVAEEIHLKFKDKKKKIVILVGPGNNGADGFVIARLLKRKGFHLTRVFLLIPPAKPSPLWLYQQEKAKNSEVEIVQASFETMRFTITEADVVVDAVFGTGLDRPLSSDVGEFFNFLNSKKKYVVAVDIPSGLDANKGYPFSEKVCLRAQMTITFGLVKVGMLIAKGPYYCGKIKVHHIGFPKALLLECSETHFAFGASAASQILPQRSWDSSKASHGKAYIFAGSGEFPGAGILASRAAGRVGAGYVYLSNFADKAHGELEIPEVIPKAAHNLKLSELDKQTAIVVGPGLGVNEKTTELIRELKRKKFANVVIDADAITVCVNEKLFPLPSSWIVTPHAGEMKRILGDYSPIDRFRTAQQAVEHCGCIVLVKGYRSIVANKQKAVVILSGNAALAKAGTGDVLAGFIGGLQAQGLDGLRAACLAAYLHGRLADEWVKGGKDIISLLPSDLIEGIPELIQKIRKIKGP